MEDVVSKAVVMGIVEAHDVARVCPDHMPAIMAVMEFMEMDEAHSADVCEMDMQLYMEEVMELADIMDLEDCDRVEPNKSFEHDEVGINIPDSMIPFMRGVILPALREIILSR